MNQYFYIFVNNFTNPYFEQELSDVDIFSGQNSEIILPNIVNPSNVDINFE